LVILFSSYTRRIALKNTFFSSKNPRLYQQRVGIPNWTAHDLRRTFATQLGEALRIDPVVIEKCLGHKMPRIMATYNRNEMLYERKEALDAWAEYIENLLQNNVVSIQKRA
jgi:integrase